MTRRYGTWLPRITGTLTVMSGGSAAALLARSET